MDTGDVISDNIVNTPGTLLCVIFSIHHFEKMLSGRLRMVVFAEKTWILEIAVGGFKYVVCTSVRYHDNETTRRAMRAKGLLAEIWCIAVVSVCAAQLYF